MAAVEGRLGTLLCSGCAPPPKLVAASRRLGFALLYALLCSVGMLRRRAPSACSVGMLRRHAPRFCVLVDPFPYTHDAQPASTFARGSGAHVRGLMAAPVGNHRFRRYVPVHRLTYHL